jgi:hypothetical protein
LLFPFANAIGKSKILAVLLMADRFIGWKLLKIRAKINISPIWNYRQ